MNLTGYLYGAIVACMTVGTMYAGSPKRDALLMETGEEVIGVAPLGSVLKFYGDTVMVSCGEWHSIVEGPVQFSIADRRECLSEMAVEVVMTDCDDDVFDGAGVEGAIVTLHNELMDDFFGIVQFADGEGVAIFHNLPLGLYDVYAVDPTGMLGPVKGKSMLHIWKDTVRVKLKENEEVSFQETSK